MTRIRKTVVALFLAVGSLGLLPVLAAAASQTDAVSGVEVFATNVEGVFVGVASGELPGFWSADVKHNPLSGNTPADITSGSFSLLTVNQPQVITGSFDKGSVTQLDGFMGCTDQHFNVVGGMHVGSQSPNSSSFSAVLTHLRVKIFGHCFTYAATVAGTVNLTF